MKIIGVGQNYHEHIKEMGAKIPDEPVIFLKPDTALLKNNDPFYYPDFSNEIHYETEVVVRIEKEGKHIDEKFASKYYHSVALGIDFTARDLQKKAKEKGLPWALAKGFNDSAPVSEFILLSELETIDKIQFSLFKNGTLVQQGNTRDLIFTVDFLISYISKFITLKKGDLIFTGTPSGVGPVAIGDRLEGFLENKQVLDFYVK